MADTNIEWTGKTWNPIAGCSLDSPGCTNCYAMKMAGRLETMGMPLYQGTTQKTKAGFVWTGKVNVAPDDKLLEPLRCKKPATWFVNSMSDLFHPNVPDDVIDRVFAVMALCPQHTFQVLTKRSGRMRAYMEAIDNGDGERLEGFRDVLIEGMAQSVWHGLTGDETVDQWLAVHLPLPNVWLGVSVEDRARKSRIDDLRQTAAAVRFLSCEPLLEDLGELDLTDIDWVIVGGESGPGARPMHPDWVRSIRDQCAAQGVAFFFKQWGDWMSFTQPDASILGEKTLEMALDGRCWIHPNHKTTTMVRVGKKRAGRHLDGLIHDAMPGRATSGAIKASSTVADLAALVAHLKDGK